MNYKKRTKKGGANTTNNRTHVSRSNSGFHDDYIEDCRVTYNENIKQVLVDGISDEDIELFKLMLNQTHKTTFREKLNNHIMLNGFASIGERVKHVDQTKRYIIFLFRIIKPEIIEEIMKDNRLTSSFLNDNYKLIREEINDTGNEHHFMNDFLTALRSMLKTHCPENCNKSDSGSCKNFEYGEITKNFTIVENPEEEIKYSVTETIDYETQKTMVDIEYGEYKFSLDPELYFKKCRGRKVGSKSMSRCHINLDIFGGEINSGEFFTHLFQIELGNRTRGETLQDINKQFGLYCTICPEILQHQRHNSRLNSVPSEPFNPQDPSAQSTGFLFGQTTEPEGILPNTDRTDCQLENGIISFVDTKAYNNEISKIAANKNQLNVVRHHYLESLDKDNKLDKQTKFLLTSYDKMNLQTKDSLEEMFSSDEEDFKYKQKIEAALDGFKKILLLVSAIIIGVVTHGLVSENIYTLLTTGIGAIGAKVLGNEKMIGEVGLFEEESEHFRASSVPKGLINIAESSTDAARNVKNFIFLMYDCVLFLAEKDLILEVYLSYIINLVKNKPDIYISKIGRILIDLVLKDMSLAIKKMRGIFNINNEGNIVHNNSFVNKSIQSLKDTWNYLTRKIIDNKSKNDIISAQHTIFRYLSKKIEYHHEINTLINNLSTSILKLVLLSNEKCKTEQNSTKISDTRKLFCKRLYNLNLLDGSKTLTFFEIAESDFISLINDSELQINKYYFNGRFMPLKTSIMSLFRLTSPNKGLSGTEGEEILNEYISVELSNTNINEVTGEYKDYVTKYLDLCLVKNLENDNEIINKVFDILESIVSQINIVELLNNIAKDVSSTYSFDSDEFLQYWQNQYTSIYTTGLTPAEIKECNLHLHTKIKSCIEGNILNIKKFLKFYFDNSLCEYKNFDRIFVTYKKDSAETRGKVSDNRTLLDNILQSNLIESIFINKYILNNKTKHELTKLMDQTFLMKVFNLKVDALHGYIPLFRNSVEAFKHVSDIYHKFKSKFPQMGGDAVIKDMSKLSVYDNRGDDERDLTALWGKLESMFNSEHIVKIGEINYSQYNLLGNYVKNYGYTVKFGYYTVSEDSELENKIDEIISNSYSTSKFSKPKFLKDITRFKPDYENLLTHVIGENASNYLCYFQDITHDIGPIFFECPRDHILFPVLFYESPPENYIYYTNSEKHSYLNNVPLHIININNNVAMVKTPFPIIYKLGLNNNYFNVPLDSIETLKREQLNRYIHLKQEIIDNINQYLSINQKCLFNYNLSTFANLPGADRCIRWVRTLCNPYKTDTILSEDLLRQRLDRNIFCDDCETASNDCNRMSPYISFSTQYACNNEENNCKELVKNYPHYGKYVKDWFGRNVSKRGMIKDLKLNKAMKMKNRLYTGGSNKLRLNKRSMNKKNSKTKMIKGNSKTMIRKRNIKLKSRINNFKSK